MIADIPMLLSSYFITVSHLQALDVPDAFLDSIRGVYDYSSVTVSLVTSVPGTYSGERASHHGLLRLWKVAKALELKLPNRFMDDELDIEVCTASIGNLNAKWLDAFVDCVLGRKKLELQDEPDVPRMTFVYPTASDVKRCHVDSQGVSHLSTKVTQSWIKCHVNRQPPT